MTNNPAEKKKFNTNLEALRGFAAIFVVINHLQVFNKIFNFPYQPKLLIEFSPNGHLCVMIFFVLSGYVIYASHAEKLTSASIKIYLKKRFVRIYPIYLIALIFTLLISATHYSTSRIFFNFALLQDLVVPPFIENGAAWSLHFEIIYYLLFIPISYFRLNPVFILMVSIGVALANYYTYPNPDTAIISSYLFGFSFWIAGLCIARYGATEQKPVKYAILISAIALFLAMDHLVNRSGLPELPDYISNYFVHQHLLYPVVESSKIIISYRDLAFLPYSIFFVIIFSGKKIKFQNVLFLLLQLPFLLTIILTGTDYFVLGIHKHILTFIIPIIYYAVGLALYFINNKTVERACRNIIRLGVWLGGISYALYIIHIPLIFAVGRTGLLNGGPGKYALKFSIFIIIALGFSYVLEKKVQPLVKNIFK